MKAGPWPAARVLRASYLLEFQKPFLQNEPNFLTSSQGLVARYLFVGVECMDENLADPACAFGRRQSRAGKTVAPRAVEELSKHEEPVRAEVRASLETHLRHEPDKMSRSRIKKLRGLRRPQYRLRVGDVRVFYDLSGTTVQVLAIVAKSEAESWLAQFGNPE